MTSIVIPDPNQYTAPFQLTKTTHRDPYPAISSEKPENSQKGKIIIITGGGTGIGAVSRSPYLSPIPTLSLLPSRRGLVSLLQKLTDTYYPQAAAKVWARANASGIVIAGRRLHLLEDVAKELKSINKDVRVHVVKLDISVEGQVEELYREVRRTFGRAADVLLNNAGILKDDKLIGEESVRDWWRVFVCSLRSLTFFDECGVGFGDEGWLLRKVSDES